jgi:hypothetical protein
MEVSIKPTNTKGKELVLHHNLPDTLRKVLPSLIMLPTRKEMDARIQSIKDPDGRMVKSVR